MIIWLWRWKERGVNGLVGEYGEELPQENPATYHRGDSIKSDDGDDHSESIRDSQGSTYTNDGSSGF